MKNNFSESKDDIFNFGQLVEKVDNIEKKVDGIVQKLDSNYLQKVEFDARFEPIAKIVYGLIMAVMSALIGIVLLFITRK